MKESTALLIIENDDTGDLDHREDYSGRSMYGDTTHGITGSEVDYANAVTAAVGELITDFEWEDKDMWDLKQVVQSFMTDALNARTDNMGFDTIWY